MSYLNTAPLVWGLEHSELASAVRLEYALPSECADRVADGRAGIGIVPVIEIERQKLDWLPSTGIACRGPVRSILLVSKTPLARITTLAADTGSRTSVMLARILLAERFGCEPRVFAMRADLDSMLAAADAALIIGDPALLLDPLRLRERYDTLDLGEEWVRHSGYPMIFALWSGKAGQVRPALDDLFVQSCRQGRAHLDEIVERECPRRGVPRELGRTYLSEHIAFELTPRDHEGMRLYLRHAREFDKLEVSV